MLLEFNGNVSLIKRCWIEKQDILQAYELDGGCQSPTANTVRLYHLDEAINNNNLTFYIEMKLVGTVVTYNTTVFVSNGDVQYFSSDSQLFTDISFAL